MNESFITLVIYFYIFICLLLLIYNISYMILSSKRKKKHLRRVKKWVQKIKLCISQVESGVNDFSKHRTLLNKKLCKTDELIAYNEAFNFVESVTDKDIIKEYLNQSVHEFVKLAQIYSKKSAMEKGYFARVISEMPFYNVNNTQALGEALLSFFSNSTIFCRQNVLLALYQISNAEIVERAFRFFSLEDIYHPIHLLSDGLLSFRGDQKKLASYLWKKSAFWEENEQVAIVRFATFVSGDLCEEFYKALSQNQRSLEVNFALVRYFRKWKYKPAEVYLRNSLKNNNSDEIAIAIASALDNYPEIPTIVVLIQSLHSTNWYVRKNAAQSLVNIGISYDYVDFLRNEGDKYAADILEYYINQDKNENEIKSEIHKAS